MIRMVNQALYRLACDPSYWRNCKYVYNKWWPHFVSCIITVPIYGRISTSTTLYFKKAIISEIKTLLLCIFLWICCVVRALALFEFALLPITINWRKSISTTFAHAGASLHQVFTYYKYIIRCPLIAANNKHCVLRPGDRCLANCPRVRSCLDSAAIQHSANGFVRVHNILRNGRSYTPHKKIRYCLRNLRLTSTASLPSLFHRG